MAKQYLNLLVPKNALEMGNFVTIVKNTFDQLFIQAHVHILEKLNAAPSATDGSKGDIYLINVGGTDYIFAKTAAGVWKKVALA